MIMIPSDELAKVESNMDASEISEKASIKDFSST
jgi:hypothetical protein